MTFPYPIITTPVATHDPADDVTNMQQNYLNIGGFLSVDHVAAGTNPGSGYHEQVTYFGNNPPTAPSDNPTISCAYTVPGVADTTHNQNVWKNTVGVFPLSSIRAFGRFVTQAVVATPPYQLTPASPITTYNVSNIVHQNAQIYIVNLVTGVVTGTSPIVLTTSSNNVVISYTFSANTLTITVSSDNPGTVINFAILQF
jgi:hypothetical protein